MKSVEIIFFNTTFIVFVALEEKKFTGGNLESVDKQKEEEIYFKSITWR